MLEKTFSQKNYEITKNYVSLLYHFYFKISILLVESILLKRAKIRYSRVGTNWWEVVHVLAVLNIQKGFISNAV
jgi:hypothetical protein